MSLQELKKNTRYESNMFPFQDFGIFMGLCCRNGPFVMLFAESTH